METVNRRAYGKVNLGLDVVGRRADGYHLVKMIMQTVDVYDDITITLKSRKADSSYTIAITCDNPEVPTNENNLVYKAAKIIFEKYGIHADICIDIKKCIPAAAGMAGGSADGAAVIKAINELFSLEMKDAEMDEIALMLGADVPFCLRKGTYISEGIGEILTKITDMPHCQMLIIKPDFGVSTVWAYKELDKYLEEHGDRNELHPDIDGLINALENEDLKRIAGKMGNILETVTLEKYPELQAIKQRLIDAGALASLMSGSGPTVFGIFDDASKAERAFIDFEGDQYGKFKVEL